jgi:hypothetical protein
MKHIEENPFAVQIVAGESADDQTDSRDRSSARFMYHALFTITPEFVAGLVFIFCWALMKE